MIDATDLSSIETEVRDLIGEETARLWTQARVFRAINAEVARLIRKVLDLDSGYLETSKTYTASSSLSLPTNCYAVRNIEAYIDGAYYPLRWIEDHEQGQYQVLGASSALPQTARFVGSTVYIESGTGASSYRIQYARIPPAMLYSAVSSATSTSFTLPVGSYFDDVYTGDVFAVLGGLGVGQYRTVTSYTPSTFTWTVGTWTTTPDATSTIGTLLPDPLNKYGEVVALGTAIRLLGRRRDTELADHLLSQYAADLGDMMESLKQRQTDQPARVNYIPDGLE